MEQNYWVYKLYKEGCEDFYIGSTKHIIQRKQEHKSICNNKNAPNHNLKVYEYIRNNGGFDEWSFEIMEHIRNSINAKELRDVEKKYIKELKPSLNMVVPNRTIREWHADNKQKVYLQRKQYRENNKELIKQQKKEARQKYIMCECGRSIKQATKARHLRSKIHMDNIE